MPEQERFLKGLGESLPYTSRERLLFSDSDIPPFLRILVPAIKKLEQFRELQQNPEWLEQQVALSRQCYNVLSNRIIYLAKQSERLQEVQTDFQQ